MTEGWAERFGSGDAMRAYDGILRPRLFDPWAAMLLDRLAVAAGEHVLDVATGPGTVARAAAARVGPGGRVVGADVSPVMLATARGKPPVDGGAEVEYVQCAAGALALPDAAFDVVTCQLGIQFFPDRPAALAEMRRVARPGARLGVVLWRPIAESPLFDALATALREAFGDDAAAAYRDGPWGWTDGEELRRLAEAAGWREARLHRADLPVALDGGARRLVATLATAPVATRLAELDDAGFAAFTATVERAVAPLRDGEVLRSTTAGHVVTAVA